MPDIFAYEISSNFDKNISCKLPALVFLSSFFYHVIPCPIPIDKNGEFYQYKYFLGNICCISNFIQIYDPLTGLKKSFSGAESFS